MSNVRISFTFHFTLQQESDHANDTLKNKCTHRRGTFFKFNVYMMLWCYLSTCMLLLISDRQVYFILFCLNALNRVFSFVCESIVMRKLCCQCLQTCIVSLKYYYTINMTLTYFLCTKCLHTFISISTTYLRFVFVTHILLVSVL